MSGISAASRRGTMTLRRAGRKHVKNKPKPQKKAVETMTPKEKLAELAKAALEATDGFLASANLTPEQLELHNQVMMAGCYAGAAYDMYLPKSGGECHAVTRAFLIALFDTLHPDLDYLRDDPASGAKEREKAQRGRAS